MTDPRTLAIYEEKAADYAVIAEEASDDPLLAAFIAAVPTGARVLDLGCGPGVAAKRMMDAGLEVDATDASAEMVGMAKTLGVAAQQAAFADLDSLDFYDGVWANFSLLHAPKSEFPGHLAQVHAALREGGLFHIAVKTGTGEHRDRLGRFYAYYQPDELAALLGDAGFSIDATATGTARGLSGEDAPWIAVRAYA